MMLDGWITEKIFDCFYSGTIPVYLGAPDIDDWIRADCFVDMRGFSDFAELRAFLKQLSPAEQGLSDLLCRHDRKGVSCLRFEGRWPTSLMPAPPSRGVSP
jgi:hypothetical protein